MHLLGPFKVLLLFQLQLLKVVLFSHEIVRLVASLPEESLTLSCDSILLLSHSNLQWMGLILEISLFLTLSINDLIKHVLEFSDTGFNQGLLSETS